jgi:hypothetical protein
VNQLPQSPVVFAVRVNGVKSVQAAPAKSTPAVFVEGSRVQERTAAINAEVLCEERLGSVQTRKADWDSGDVFKALAAYAAIVGEDEVKQR